MSRVDPDKLFAHLDELGEEEVRKRLASDAVYGGDKKGLVEFWLAKQDQARAEAVTREQIEVARAAAAAARDAADSASDSAASARVMAREARKANTMAKIAIAIATAGIIISIFGLFVPSTE